MEQIIAALRSAAEPTRFRILALCAKGELTVSELTQILGQSQPRVSRHLKLLCEAGLLRRLPEGTWAFYRLSESDPGATVARTSLGLAAQNDIILQRDLDRLKTIKAARAEAAAAYFRANAAQWRQIRSHHVDEAEVESALRDMIGAGQVGDLVDIGTGTGRMLEVLADRYRHATGIDMSREMLAVARAALEKAGIAHAQVRQGDMYNLPLDGAEADLALIHQVLHYAEEPGKVIGEAARILKPDGRLLIVDFAPHGLEDLREQAAHRRLGFSDAEVRDWCHAAGLKMAATRSLPGKSLTVMIWSAVKPATGTQLNAPRRSSRIVK